MRTDTFLISVILVPAVVLLILFYCKSAVITIYNQTKKPSTILFLGYIAGMIGSLFHLLLIFAEFLVPIWYVVYVFLIPHLSEPASIYSLSEGFHVFFKILSQLNAQEIFTVILALLVVVSGVKDFDDWSQSWFSKK